jgi:hypothetical protein
MVFESQTIATCREARVVHKLQHDVLDVKKPGAAAKAREYLLKNLGIDIGDKQRYSEWDHLMNLRRLRNCIVHEAGRVRGDEIVKAFGSLQLTYAGLLSSVRDYFSDVPILLVREPLCRRFLDSVETFFPRLFSDCGIRTQPPVAPAAQPSQ